jgi:hypothetical protein
VEGAMREKSGKVKEEVKRALEHFRDNEEPHDEK